MAEGRAPRINGHMLANVSFNRPAITARPSAAWRRRACAPCAPAGRSPANCPEGQGRGAKRPVCVQTCVCVCADVCVCMCVCVLLKYASSADPLASRMDQAHAAPRVRRVRGGACAWHFGVCLAHARQRELKRPRPLPAPPPPGRRRACAAPMALLALAILTQACPACAPARRRYSHCGRTYQGQRSGVRGASRGPLRQRDLHRPLGCAANFHHRHCGGCGHRHRF